MAKKIQKTEKEWQSELSPQEYEVARQGGTERAFTGRYWDHKGEGTYRCVGCGQELFSSDTKYDSGSGWPSFYQPTGDDAVEVRHDNTHGMSRDEVVCSQCDSHLGHVFSDGPKPTGQRYCINSVSLKFDDEK